MTRIGCETRLEGLEKAWKSFEDNHEKMLEQGVDLKAEYFTTDFFSSTEETYYDRKSEFKEFLFKLSGVSHSNTVSETQNIPRLPRLNIPTFSGEFRDWESYRDLFTSLVISRTELSNISKLHYLQTSLAGEASQITRSLPLTGDNFERAWRKLTETYENKRRLVNSHVATLFSLKAVQSETSAELKRLLHATINPLLALEALERPTEQWDDLIVYLTVSRLDDQSRKEWETSLGGSQEPPKFEKLRTFLETRSMTLEAIEHSCGKNISHPRFSRKLHNFSGAKTQIHQCSGSSDVKVHHLTQQAPTSARKCSLCCKPHFILRCDVFRSKTPQQRKEFVAVKRLCYNCLGVHSVKECSSTKRCRQCQGKHHTMLHLAPCYSPIFEETSVDNVTQTDEAKDTPQSIIAGTAATSVNSTRTVSGREDTILLATAWIYVTGATGERTLARALIDQCAQSSFISESLCQRLRLKRRPVLVPVTGIGSSHQTTCKGAVGFTIQPRFLSTFSCHVDAFVLPKVTSYTPVLETLQSNWTHLRGLTLADPRYMDPGTIDVLLGAAVHAQVVEGQVMKGHEHEAIATLTSLGWILSVETKYGFTNAFSSPKVLHCVAEQGLDKLMQRFWEQEELQSRPRHLKPDEQSCEDHYVATHTRTSTGRYVVRIPFKSNPGSSFPRFGNSYSSAVKMLLQMERRFLKHVGLQTAYSDFMREYESLGHMKPVYSTLECKDQDTCFYLPHHGVIKEDSTTTKLRVVFNGSLKTDGSISLNELLHTGPNLLPDLSDLILRWQKYRFAFSADVEKMFRQILIHEEDQHLQSIVWRYNVNDLIVSYRLTTVTYGLACAPFLASRTLKQLAQDGGAVHPLGAQILQEEVYMDDILSGGHCLDTALAKQMDLINLLKVGGFPLRKWLSNAPELLSWLARDLLAVDSSLTLGSCPAFAVLGLSWQPTLDCFHFNITVEPTMYPPTKRSVLSRITRLFDPLGWLAPVFITAKIFIQSLWLLRLEWDEELPSAESNHWVNWYSELPKLVDLKIPRWLGFSPNACFYEMHGFADASMRAYGAVLYLRTATESGSKISLLLSKTKVAPVKTISIPRLELCAAHLLARITNHCLKILQLEASSVHLWSDSLDVLYWLRDHPSRWKTFVAIRCSEILTLMPHAYWHHVKSSDNPADAASRGVSPTLFGELSIWWRGPPWLSKSQEPWSLPQILREPDKLNEIRVTTHVATPSIPEIWELLFRFSRLPKLLIVTGYCLRFISKLITNLSIGKHLNSSLFNLDIFKLVGIKSESNLSADELERARLVWVYLVQRVFFKAEIRALSANSVVPRGSQLSYLNPFLDKGLLRVGGRLRHSLLSDDEKHPLILPHACQLTTLIIERCHHLTLHGGIQLTLSTLRRQYWVLRGRQAVKSVIHRCTTCLRYKASAAYQQMGNLPPLRVKPGRPFQHSGVDYAGPIQIRTSHGRGRISFKGYIAVFVCLSTRAVHLEVVSSYSTEDFLAAFRRFTSRRGHCATLTSDRGTNFVGADAELRQLYNLAFKHSRDIAHSLAKDGTSWRYNPPAAPHFGGIWEAAVKSMKHHLRRVIGDHHLTFEELATLLCQVEACLNSRPLFADSDDPTDLQPITPAHFLIGTSSFLIPEPDLSNEQIPISRRWKLLTQMTQHVWNRWSSEYLQALQTRSKWTAAMRSIQRGDLVLIRNELTPPAKWPLARVLETHPGDDSLVRVVTLRTATSTFKRPIVKLILLRQSEAAD